LFGVIAPKVIVDLLAGRRVKSRIMVDVSDLPRPFGTKMRIAAARLVNLVMLSNELKRSGKNVYSGGTGEEE
jgi:hypothetical protein